MNDFILDKLSLLKQFITDTNNIVKLLIAREAVLLLLYMAAAAMTLNVFMQTRSFEEGSKTFGLAAMLDGTAERPYVYRQLLPMIANFAADLVPEQDQEAFVNYHLDKYHLKQQYFGKAKYANPNIEPWTPSYSIKFHVIYLFNFLSLLGLAYILRALVDSTIHNQRSLALTAPIMFLLMLPMSFMHGNFFYDFPELFFLGGLLLAAIKGHYYWWVILLPIAVLNKESNILVPLLYFPIIYYASTDWRKTLNIALAILLSAAAYLYIQTAFSDNPGATTIWQLWKNIDFWSTPRNYFLWNDFYAPVIPFPRGLNIFFISVLFLLVSVSWKNLPKQVKGLFVVSLVINTPLWLLYCHNDEMRNLSFTFIPLFLVITFSLSKLLQESFPPSK
jgi:hypothetical protein